LSDVTFILLSFEGPDQYAHAGGLGSRVSGLSEALADMGFETHLFFIGDPDLPGHEAIGNLHVHRWCQWISRHHPSDWNRSLPEWLETELIAPRMASNTPVVVLGEEWHTTGTLLRLREIVLRRGWAGRVHLVWNANNIFGFDRIDWAALGRAVTVTTVSRYMKHVLWDYGVDARVVPNGIPEDWMRPVDRRACADLSRLFRGRMTLLKVARFDPDKRWDMSVDAVALLRRQGRRPLFLARGGLEAHGAQVLERARQNGLRLGFARWSGRSTEALAEALAEAQGPFLLTDMVVLEGYLSLEQRRALFHVVDAVLANSGIEPFGLVGLETMAVGGVAFVGCTGEDYVTHGHDAISLQTSDPREIARNAIYLRLSRKSAAKLRKAARHSAARYTWRAVIQRVLPLFLEGLGVSVVASRPDKPMSPRTAPPVSPPEAATIRAPRTVRRSPHDRLAPAVRCADRPR
jgi:glycosyltransferase involved in cell wall biosynthesis